MRNKLIFLPVLTTVILIISLVCTANDPLTSDLYTSGLYVNGHAVTPENYVPYSGATGNLDLNTKNLKNVTQVGIGTTATNASLDANGDIDWSAGNLTYVPLTGNIQTYVNNAVAGDTLILASGQYTISSTITIDKQLNLIGQGNAGFVTIPSTASHGTLISSSTNNVVAFQIDSDNVSVGYLSINLTGANAMAVNTANNLKGLVFTNIDVIVNSTGTVQAFTIYGSNAVLRDLSFFVTSTDSTASGVLAYNNATTTQDMIVDSFNVTGTVKGSATSAYAFGAWNDNDDNTISLNLSNTVAKSLTGTPLDVAIVSYSTTTNNSIVNAYLCTFDGADYDAFQTGTNQLNLGGSVIVNGKIFGAPTYRATMASGNLIMQSGALLPTPRAGALEFLTDTYYMTSTTGTTRQGIAGVTIGTAAPAAAPIRVGDIFVDTTNHKVYIADGTTNSANWLVLN